MSSKEQTDLKIKLAIQVLETKPSYCKENADFVANFLHLKTGQSFSREEALIACRDVRNRHYPKKPHPGYEVMQYVNEVNAAKGILDNVTYSSALSIEPIIKTEKNDRIDEPGMYIALPCVHVPFHNKKLWSALLKFISNYNKRINGILIMGDFLDMNSLSAHDKGFVPIPGVTLDFEYKEGNKALDELDIAMDGNPYAKFYLFGNHEDRYFRTIKEVNNSKYGSSLLSPITALNLIGRGYNVLSDWKNDSIRLGPHLEVIHGEFITTTASKKHIDVYRKSIVFCHTHRIGSYLEGQTAGYNLGFMGDVNSPAFGYAGRGMKSNWNNGFGIINLDENLCFNVQQIIWYNNAFYVGHEKYN